MQTAGGKKDDGGSPPTLTLKYVSKGPSNNDATTPINEINSPYESAQTANSKNNKRKKLDRNKRK